MDKMQARTGFFWRLLSWIKGEESEYARLEKSRNAAPYTIITDWGDKRFPPRNWEHQSARSAYQQTIFLGRDGISDYKMFDSNLKEITILDLGHFIDAEKKDLSKSHDVC
jgi:hypothetical protein